MNSTDIPMRTEDFVEPINDADDPISDTAFRHDAAWRRLFGK